MASSTNDDAFRASQRGCSLTCSRPLRVFVVPFMNRRQAGTSVHSMVDPNPGKPSIQRINEIAGGLTLAWPSNWGLLAASMFDLMGWRASNIYQERCHGFRSVVRGPESAASQTSQGMKMAGNQNRRDVSGNRRDGYKVTGEGKTTATAKTQGDAEAKAKSQVGQAGGGQVYIHRPDGKIRDADTVKPGNESPTKDTKH